MTKKQKHSYRLLLAVQLLVVFFAAASAYSADNDSRLIGRWKMIEQALDAQGNRCMFVPDELEFFSDGTVSMSNMQGMKIPFKTALSDEERKSAALRLGTALKGKKPLLMKPHGVEKWTDTPIAYAYSIEKGNFIMSMPGWSAAKFEKATRSK